MRAKKLLHMTQNETQYNLSLEWLDENHAQLSGTLTPPGSDEPQDIEVIEARASTIGQEIRIKSHKGAHSGYAVRTRDGLWIAFGAQTLFFEATRRDLGTDGAKSQESEILAPMTGKIINVRVEQGQKVSEGEILVILEAMKMEFKLEAPMDAVIESVNCEVNQQVELGQLLVKLEPKESE